MLHHDALYTPQRLIPNVSDLVLSEHQHRDIPPIGKKRRGRQPRQSLLTNNLRQAIARFTSVVGAPIVQPGGFRDFNGWLTSLARPQYASAWHQLCDAFTSESRRFHSNDLYQLKRDVIHEIINLVVKRKPHESSKLVSTNARRQCTIPPTGNTVMTLLDSYLTEAPPYNRLEHHSQPPLVHQSLDLSKDNFSQSTQSLYIQNGPLPSKCSLPIDQPMHIDNHFFPQMQPLSKDTQHLLVHSDSFHESSKNSFPINQIGHIQHHSHRLEPVSPIPIQNGSLKWHRDSSSSRASSSRQQKNSSRKSANSNMDISSLLTDEHLEVRRDRDVFAQRRLSSQKSKLPSLSQLDAQLQFRERNERNRQRW